MANNISSLLATLFGGGAPGGATPAPDNGNLNMSALMSEIFGNAGQAVAPGSGVGAAPAQQFTPGFDPTNYGVAGGGMPGEALYYGQTASGGAAPLAALFGLGAPKQGTTTPKRSAPRPAPRRTPPGSNITKWR